MAVVFVDLFPTSMQIQGSSGSAGCLGSSPANGSRRRRHGIIRRVEADELRRWAEQRALGAKRELSELSNAASPPEEAFETGLRMIALAARLHGWPLPKDEREVQEELEIFHRWARLRRRLTNV